MRVATVSGKQRILVYPGISIHATHAGGDHAAGIRYMARANFNPRHPCGWRRRSYSASTKQRYFNPRHPCGWRPPSRQMWDFLQKFQSTPPMRVATLLATQNFKQRIHFNPRHPCGWRLRQPTSATSRCDFNPRHPCGWRLQTDPGAGEGRNFNPRHPCGWRLRYVESSLMQQHFNPRHPCGWRRGDFRGEGKTAVFQSTPPMRVATGAGQPDSEPLLISIHATHAGGDRPLASVQSDFRNFNPRHPCGWRRGMVTSCKLHMDFNPRHPCGWRLIEIDADRFVDGISIHATHAGGDRWWF